LIGHDAPTLHMDDRAGAELVARLHEAREDMDEDGNG
jgi:hypothetical protein